MSRRFRINGPLLLALFLTIAALAIYITWPLLGSWISQQAEEVSQTSSSSRTNADIIRERGITCVTGLWFFVFGASIGSFLNVVAYRMPMGLTIVSKPSRCPFCETPIRFKHNVPIFGWLALRGRCNACRLPISPRYILIEIIVGTLFFLVFWRELASGGANLPIEWERPRPGVMWNVLTPNWRLIGLYFFHSLLIGTLATIALIKFDRLKTPFRLVAFAVVAAIGLTVVWPTLMVSTWWSLAEMSLEFERPWESLMHSLSGAVVGFLVGWAGHCIVESNYQRIPSAGSRAGLIATNTIAGAFLGWQIVVPFFVLTAFLQFVQTLLAKLFARSANRLWASSTLFAAVLLICIWKQLSLLGLPSAESGLSAHWIWLTVGLATAYVAAVAGDE